MSAEHLAGPYREPVKPPPPEGDRLARYRMELELEEGERLLWAGRPPQGLRLRLIDIFAIPFSLVWGGFAITWEVLAIVFNAPFIFALVGLPFVIIGFHLMIGRFFDDARERAKTFYGVTDQRAIIVLNETTRQMKSLDLEERITLKESKNGYGSIEFADQPLSSTPRGRVAKSAVDKGPNPIFEGIPDARAVYRMLMNARDELRERRRAAEKPPTRAPDEAGDEEEQGNDHEDISNADRIYRA
jgi:hypothetical protein